MEPGEFQVYGVWLSGKCRRGRNIKVRGQRMSACGELGEVGRAQVNQRMETIHGAGQQQEPIEVISGASH